MWNYILQRRLPKSVLFLTPLRTSIGGSLRAARAAGRSPSTMEGIKFVSKDEIDDAKKRKKEAEAARAAKEDAERKTKRAERKAVSMPRAERRPPTREHTRPDARAHTRSHAPARRVPIGRGEW